MILHIRAIEAADIPQMDFGGKADPYLTFQLDKSPEIFKTKVVNQNFNPIWNQVFDIPIYEGNPNILHVELVDMDKLKSDDLISTRDFEINHFKLGEVTEDWFDFFPSPKVESPGKVHLIFHLANPEDEPFIPKLPQDQVDVKEKDVNVQQETETNSQNSEAKDVTNQQSEIHSQENNQQEEEEQNRELEQQRQVDIEVEESRTDHETKTFEQDRDILTVNSGRQSDDHTSQSQEVQERHEDVVVEKQPVQEREIDLSTEKVSSSNDRDDFEVFSEKNLQPMTSTERINLINEEERLNSESRFKMILFVVIVVELLILFLKSKH
ncbi:Protein Aster-C [Tritrichomonas musculus]|uniref:Protein Aster-C n=1 Tax=Tritrichomonas musculus TaxID=1915356 RepID=A0ABR2HH77_9EUKA